MIHDYYLPIGKYSLSLSQQVRVMRCYKHLIRMMYFIKESRLQSLLFEQPIELLLVKIELLSKTFWHYITPYTNMQ